MRQSPEKVYPFYLIKEMPFMKIGSLQAAVLWGAVHCFGKGQRFTVQGKRHRARIPKGLDAVYDPELITAHYQTPTDIVVGCDVFRFQSFTMDLANEALTFHNQFDINRIFLGKKIYIQTDFLPVPTVIGGVGDTELLLQVDIGDTLSVLPPHSTAGHRQVGEETRYLNETDPTMTTIPVYEVPIRLSAELTVTVRARAIREDEQWKFDATCTHGSIGLDLIRSCPVTFCLEYDFVARKLYEVIYVHRGS